MNHISIVFWLISPLSAITTSQPDYVHVNTCTNVQIMHPNANIDETQYFVWYMSVWTRDCILLGDFLISNDVLGGTLWVRLNMEIFKSTVLLANEHQSDQKKCYQWFSYKFLLCIRSCQNDSVNGMPENIASRRILTKMAASVFHRILAISKKFAGMTHQYMEIYHTKKQTEKIPRSCSYLLLQILFYSYRSVLQYTLSWKWLV